jgi:hypothetical protein
MTTEQTKNLLHLIATSGEIRTSLETEQFMDNSWLPFVRSLSNEDQRFAWLTYMDAQIKQFSTLVQYLTSQKDISTFRPELERIVALRPLIEQWGKPKLATA